MRPRRQICAEPQLDAPEENPRYAGKRGWTGRPPYGNINILGICAVFQKARPGAGQCRQGHKDRERSAYPVGEEHDFSKGSMARNILAMAIPMTIAQLVNVLYNVTDRFFIGRIGGGASSLALTGVGIVFPIINIITAFTNLYGMGGAPLCSIARGRKEDAQAERIMGASCFMLAVTALVLTAIGVAFMDPILWLFGASQDTFPYAKDYFAIYIWGTFFAMMSLGMNGFINCQGFGRTGMITIAAGAAVNVVLDPLLIFGLNMGVRGAAVATVISQILATWWVMRFLTGKKALLKLRRECVRWQPDILKDTVQLGLSHFMMSFTNGVTQFAYNRALSGLGGDVYIGAMTVINSVREVMTMPANGITGGAQPVLGYNYGAKKNARVKKGILFTTGICVAYTLVAWGVVFLFPHELIRIFNDNPQLVEVGARMMHIYFFGFCFMALQFSGQSTFTALGRARYAIFFSIFRKLVVVVPLIFILPNFMGVEGVFWSEPISNLVGGSACFITMMLTLWRKL